MKVLSTLLETEVQLAALRENIQRMDVGGLSRAQAQAMLFDLRELDAHLGEFELRQYLRSIVETMGGTVGLYFEDLSDGQIIEINGDEIFPAASVIKVLVLVHILNLGVDLEKKIYLDLSLPRFNQVDGSGMLNYLQSDVELSVADLLTAMIIDSDNVATNVLLETYGNPNARQLFPALNLRHTRLNSLIDDFGRLEDDDINPTTPAEIAAVFHKAIFEFPAGEVVLDILSRQRNRSRIPFFLPDEPELVIAHKTGTLDHVVHDAGVVLSPRTDYVLAILSKNQPSTSNAIFGIARMSELVYRFVQTKYEASERQEVYVNA